MAGIFGLPTSQEVRQAQNQRLFGSLPQYGGPQAGALQGASAIGAALGSLFAGDSAAEKKAVITEQIQNDATMKFGSEIKGIKGIQEVGTYVAERLAKEGMMPESLAVMKQLSALVPGDVEFKKEERSASRASVKGMESKAALLRSDYGKLEQLSKRAKGKGTSARAARNSMIANIVRLNSPGIVSETELRTYTGGQGTTAAMMAFLSGKGVDTSALMANIDPSGKDFDVDGMLGLGKDLILGQAAPIFDRLDDARDRASRAGLSKRAQDTIFGKSRNITALKKLTTPEKTGLPTGVTEADIITTMKIHNMTREQVLQGLNK